MLEIILLLLAGDLIFFRAVATREGQRSDGHDNTEDANTTSALVSMLLLLLLVVVVEEV